MPMRFPLPILALSLALTALAAEATAVTVTASRDNTLYEDPTGALSNGAGTGLFAGRTGDGTLRRAVVAFDLAAAVPPGSTVTSAELILTVDMSISGATDMPLHRLLADWGEAGSVAVGGSGGGGAGGPAQPGDATWIHTFFNTGFWTAIGGDFDPTVSATTSAAGAASYSWGSTPEMVADVQAWVDDPSQNFGWILLGDEVNDFSAKRFASRENVAPALRPQLMLEVDGLGAPAAPEVPALSAIGLTVLALILGGLALGLLRRRAA